MKIAVSNLTGAERAALRVFAWAGGAFKDESQAHAAIYAKATPLHGEPHGVVAGERFTVRTFQKLLDKNLIYVYGDEDAGGVEGRRWCRITPIGAGIARQLRARKR